MSAQILSQTGALSSGSTLWVLPSADNSVWTKKLDWYMNFQLARANYFQQMALPEPLVEMATNLEVPVPTIEVSKKAPLLVSTVYNMPNEITLYMPFTGELSTWLKQIHEVWSKLHKPSLRIFAPDGIDTEDIEKSWPDPTMSEKLTLVPQHSRSSAPV